METLLKYEDFTDITIQKTIAQTKITTKSSNTQTSTQVIKLIAYVELASQSVWYQIESKDRSILIADLFDAIEDFNSMTILG